MNSLTRTAAIKILFIGADEHDHAVLANILANPTWVVIKAQDLAAARSALKDHNVSVVLYDCDSTQDHFTKIADDVQQMPLPAPIIITSRLADDRLWSQALDSGVWDVLSKPLRTAEVVRSLRYAWEHWRNL